MSTPRIAIWAAVSTPAQAADDKDSLKSQVRDGREWAESRGAEVVRVYQVPGHSRRYIFLQEAARDMPAYAEVMRDCKDGPPWDVLWIRGRDRLGRMDALIAQVEAVVLQSGASIYSDATGVMSGDDQAEGALYVSAFERASAQAENRKRKKRHRFGMLARTRRGLPPGKWPYGLRPVRNEKGESVAGELIESEAAVVRRITDMFLSGAGYGSIAGALNEDGIPAPGGSQWWRKTVRYMMHNDMYAGRVEFGEYQTPEKSDRFPAIWDEETYRRVKRERGARHVGGRPPATAASGSVRCLRCGGSMVYHPGHSTYDYYRCSKHSNAFETGETCHANYTRVEDIIEAIDAWKDLLVENEALVESVARDAMPKARRIEQEMERARAAVEEIRRRQDRLALAVEVGNLSANVVRRRNDALEEQLEAAEVRLREAQVEMDRLPSREERVASLQAFGDALGEMSITNLPVERGQALLRDIGMVIWCEESKVRKVEVFAT